MSDPLPLDGEWSTITVGPNATVLARFTEAGSGRQVLTGLALVGDAITADQLRQIPVAKLESLANQPAHEQLESELDALPVLRRSTGMDPAAFSRLVADHYKAWSRAVPHPAHAMALRAGVKAATMHSWIREARLRGFLPPGQRQKIV